MTHTFTIRGNPGPAVKTFTATTFEAFVSELGNEWSIGSEDGLRSFFYDRHQVKSLIGINTLVCR